MHMSMGGLNKVLAVFIFSPAPAYNKVEIFPNPLLLMSFFTI